MLGEASFYKALSSSGESLWYSKEIKLALKETLINYFS